MVLFVLLAAIAAVLTAFVFFCIIVGGSIGVILCGDIIVCITLIVLIIRHFWFKKKEC